MSFKSKWKNFWSNLFSSPQENSTKKEKNPRGVNADKVRGHNDVQSTLDKLNGK
jgi:hypothetical protein